MAYFTGGLATFTTDGTTLGSATVDNAAFLVEGAICYLGASGLPGLEVKVLSLSGNTVTLRSTAFPPQPPLDLSAYTVGLSATLMMPAQNIWGSMAVAGGASTASTINTTSTGSATTATVPEPITAGAPVANLAISTTSAVVTGLVGGYTYRIAATVPCYFRVGDSSVVALTTDAPMFGPSVENITLPTAATAIAFVTSTGTGTVTITRLA